jgi:hypothetical protein
MQYEDFIATKSTRVESVGFDPGPMPEWMFPHQAALTSWALRKGRAAVFADTGLGKTSIELVWADRVARHTSGRVIVLAPLAVANQIVAEGRARGIDAQYMRQDDGRTRIVVTNYELLHAFDASAFVGVVLDESGILKNFTGKTRNALIEAFAGTKYKLCGTATPAPNDFTELGNHSEFLGVKSRAEMLAEYFAHDGGSTQDWRIKGHAVASFWRWVVSWGAVVMSPEDLGFDGAAYKLPPLRMHSHIVHEDFDDARASGMLFPMDARTLQDQRRVRNATIEKRIEAVAIIAKEPGPLIVWCELNAEADGIEDALEHIDGGCVQVSGADSIDSKLEKLAAFAEGRARVIITKTSVTGFGLNWQHCARMVFVGASHSYESTYQAIRRCWRFGQKRAVDVHTIHADTERFVIENYRRKEADAARLAASLVQVVGEHVRAEVVGRSAREWNEYTPSVKMMVPAWAGQEAQQ